MYTHTAHSDIGEGGVWASGLQGQGSLVSVSRCVCLILYVYDFMYLSLYVCVLVSGCMYVCVCIWACLLQGDGWVSIALLLVLISVYSMGLNTRIC